MKYKEFNDFYNLYDGDETVGQIFEERLRHITFKLFQDQEEWIQMAYQNGEKYPRIKDNAFEVFSRVYDETMNFMKWQTIYSLMDMYYRDVINVSDDVRHRLEEHFGHSYSDWPTEVEYDKDFNPQDERATREVYSYEE